MRVNGVVLSAEYCASISARLRRDAARTAALNGGGGVPGWLAALIEELDAASGDFAAISSARGTDPVPLAELARHSVGEEMGTDAAADLLGITERYVRQLCANATITARKVGDHWLIERTEVLDYKRTREAA